jgi:hypothetical protein
MKAEFLVRIDIDSAALELEAKRRGLTLTRALESILADAEGRLSDSLRFRPAIARVGVEQLTQAGKVGA